MSRHVTTGITTDQPRLTDPGQIHARTEKVQPIGGCCGVGPGHIRALAGGLPRRSTPAPARTLSANIMTDPG
jgi:hypothetical protein